MEIAHDKPSTQPGLIAYQDKIRALKEVNLQDLFESFGLQDLRRGRGLLRAVFHPAARRFARQMVVFDEMTGTADLQTAASYTLRGYTARLEVSGQEHLPEHGPLLILSNHPGMVDTLVLFSTLPRRDLKVVAAERPFLRALHNVSRQLLYISDDPGQRMTVVRTAAAHLRRGGAVLTFPAGEIEPDPATRSGALESLAGWSDSVALFARLAPDVQIVTAIVSGVIWPGTLDHPLTRLRSQRQDQERLGATLQVLIQTLLPFYRPVTTRVAYSSPIPGRDFDDGRDAAGLMHAIRTSARELIETLPDPLQADHPPVSQEWQTA